MCIYILGILSYCIAAAFIGFTFFQFYFTKDVFTNTPQTFMSDEYQDILSGIVATELVD